ncbi:hypothetical protein [Rhodococcus sp. 5G237]
METITRVRSDGGWDENGDPIVIENPELTLVPLGIAPGATNEMDAVGRDGELVEFTVFLEHGADVIDGDELLIRGGSYRARVRTWRPQWDPSFGGIEVVATSRVG